MGATNQSATVGGATMSVERLDIEPQPKFEITVIGQLENVVLQRCYASSGSFAFDIIQNFDVGGPYVTDLAVTKDFSQEFTAEVLLNTFYSRDDPVILFTCMIIMCNELPCPATTRRLRGRVLEEVV